MTKLGCPCGNQLWNGDESVDVQYYFAPESLLSEYADDVPFFEFQYNGMALELWKCDMCDRMMAFDDPDGAVSRYFLRVGTDTVPDVRPDAVPGLVWNNRLFNPVVEHFERLHDEGCGPDYKVFGDDPEDKPSLTPRLLGERIFNGRNGRYQDWWLAEMSQDWLIFYSIYDPERKVPVKAWRRYEQNWDEED